MKNKLVTPVCPYCGSKAKLYKSSSGFYHGKNYGPVWACAPCDAWVGCHRGSNYIPLGRLANGKLRQLKQQAHAVFDPLWKMRMLKERYSQYEARGVEYAWLAKQLNLSKAKCHIGMFDEEQCRKVIELCLQERG